SLPPLPIFTLFPYTTLFRSRYELRTVLLMATPVLGLAAAIQTMSEEVRRKSPSRFLMPLATAMERRLDPQIILGAIALIALVHVDRKSTRLNSSHSQISYAV